MKKAVIILFLFASSTLFSQSTLKDGLILHIPVEKSIVDSVANKTISAKGATLTIDRLGNPNSAIDFDGNSSNLTLSPNGFTLDTFCYSLWVKFDDVPANGKIVSLISCGGTLRDQGINIANNYGGYTGFSGFSYSKTGDNKSYTTGTLPSKGSWHHLVMNRTASTITFYLNGKLEGTSAINGLADYTGSPIQLLIGARYGSTSFKGQMDDIRIYNRTLTITEVSELHTIATASKKEIDEINQISLYPNPSTGIINVQSDFLMNEIVVFNNIGQLVFNKKDINSANYILDLKLEAGIYYTEVVSNSNTRRLKLVIQ